MPPTTRTTSGAATVSTPSAASRIASATVSNRSAYSWPLLGAVGPDDLRHEDRAEHAPGDQVVEDVGQHVGEGELVADHGGQADRGDEERGAHEAEHAGDRVPAAITVVDRPSPAVGSSVHRRRARPAASGRVVGARSLPDAPSSSSAPDGAEQPDHQAEREQATDDGRADPLPLGPHAHGHGGRVVHRDAVRRQQLYGGHHVGALHAVNRDPYRRLAVGRHGDRDGLARDEPGVRRAQPDLERDRLVEAVVDPQR